MDGQLLHELKIKSENFKIEIESINHKINEYKKLIDSCLSIRNEILDFHSFKKNYNEESKEFIGQVAALFVQNKTVSDKQINTENTINGLRESTEKFKASLEKIFAEIEAVKKGLASVNYQDQLSHMKSNLEMFKQEINSKVSSIAADLVVPPKQIIASNEDVLKKLEMAQLDGSNAILKANNMDLQIKILERRIENILQQVKKLELVAQNK